MMGEKMMIVDGKTIDLDKSKCVGICHKTGRVTYKSEDGLIYTMGNNGEIEVISNGL